MAEVNLNGAFNRLDNLTRLGRYALANQAMVDMNMYVPKRTGQLRGSSFLMDNGKKIVWNTPYARRQFYNQMNNYTTSGTGSRWDVKAKNNHIAQWESIVRSAMR